MAFFSNRDINRLVAHTTLHQLAWGASGAFLVAFLLKMGLSPAAIFLSIGAILGLRLVFRPLVPRLVTAIGSRRALVLGTVLVAAHFPILAFVQGPGLALGLFCLTAGLAEVLYWTCFHAFFSGLGDAEWRGGHVGLGQAFVGLAAVFGPAVGGFVLAVFGPFAAFVAAAVIELFAVIPLLHVSELPVARQGPPGVYEAARRGSLLMATDGWIVCGAGSAWALIMFEAVKARFDAFGGLIAIAALAGAVGGIAFGRFIDRSDGRRAAWISAGVAAGTFMLKAACGSAPVAVVAVAIGTTAIGGLYIPALLTALYHEAHASPCPLRFQVVAESGWDIGGILACLVAAALWTLSAPLPLIILLALPAVALQRWLLAESYLTRWERSRPAKDDRRQSLARST